jgi:dihydroorotase
MPIPKGPDDVAACREFATSGNERAIAGDDTAAHLSRTKHGAFGGASNGAFWTAHAIAGYARAFMRAGALDDRFEQFMSLNGAKWRSLEIPDNDDVITISREPEHDIPPPIGVVGESDVVIPYGWTTENDKLYLGFAVDE